jgi:16S rRNA (guanine966-N2)-methyltransferase
MRIIAGKNKGRKLFSLPGLRSRHSSGRVGAASFCCCGHGVAGARVADLFAGTGAFGLEALSRGAASALFVESDPRAAALIEKNAAACGVADQSTVLCRDIVKELPLTVHAGLFFDLVFMDPPYQSGILGPAVTHLVRTGRLATDSLVIIEHAAGNQLPADLSGLECVDQRKYGKTLVSFLSNVTHS